MANFFSLPIADQAKLSQDALFKYYGVTVPVTTEQSKNNLIKAQNSFGSALNQINNTLWQGPLGPGGFGQPDPARAARARAANNAPIPPELKNQLTAVLPAGYTFDGTLGQFANTLNAMSASVDNVVRNEIQLPPMGAGVTYNPNNTTPPVGTVVTPTTPTIPTNTAPATTTAPSTNTSSSAISNILTAAAVIGGGALIVNALNNRVQNSTATPVATEDNPNATPEPTSEFLDANASPQQNIDPNSDPNTNIGAENQDVTGFEPLQEPPSTADEFDGIDQQVADNENGLQEPPQLSDEEVNAYLNEAGRGSDVQESVFDPTGNGGNTGALNGARSTATNQDAKSFEKAKDWRVRLSLAPNAKYLYKADNPGILKPLQATNGVIFPYTPTVSAVYAANYDASELIHSNYKIYNYKNSNVDTVTITGDFTAQDTTEANYLLAVIQFFKSVTKMFYGQDQNPRNGTPPPLVYMSGLGTFQFDNHPLAVTNFTYSLPNEVDYIRAGSTTNEPGSSTANQTTVNNTDNASTARIQSSGLGVRVPNFQRQQATINSNATYVPTKMQIVITCIPIVTRNDISNNFSLRDYATGALLQGSKRNGGGIW